MRIYRQRNLIPIYFGVSQETNQGGAMEEVEKKRGRPKKAIMADAEEVNPKMEAHTQEQGHIDIFTGNGRPSFKAGLGEELKKSRKKYKNVGFRLEEDIFDKYEDISQKYSGVSLHTFIKDHFKKLFSEERRTKITIPIDKEKLSFLKAVGIEEDFLEELNDVLSRQIDIFIFKEMFEMFLSEYDTHDYEEVEFFEEEETAKEFLRPETIQEIALLTNIFIENYEDCISWIVNDELLGDIAPLFSEKYYKTTEEYREHKYVGFFLMIINKIKKELREAPPKNKILEDYFFNLTK